MVIGLNLQRFKIGALGFFIQAGFLISNSHVVQQFSVVRVKSQPFFISGNGCFVFPLMSSKQTQLVVCCSVLFIKFDRLPHCFYGVV